MGSLLWTDWMAERLTVLWGEGHSTAVIGGMLGITKNAVIGKAHRLNLAPRPKAIKRRDPNAPVPVKVERPKVAPKVGAALLAKRPVSMPNSFPAARAQRATHEDGKGWRDTQAVREAKGRMQANLAHLKAAGFAPDMRPLPYPPAKQMVPVRPRTKVCCYPIGEPGRPGFRMCDAPTFRGSYCAEHHAICVMPASARRIMPDLAAPMPGRGHDADAGLRLPPADWRSPSTRQDVSSVLSFWACQSANCSISASSFAGTDHAGIATCFQSNGIRQVRAK